MLKKTKKEKVPLTRGDKILRGIIISLSVILALILILLVIYNNLGKAPVVDAGTEATGTDDITGTGDDPDPEPTGSNRKEEFYTFLILGQDQSSGNTDTIMLASYDVENQKISIMSIPRDTMVNVSWDIKKINSVYGVGGIDMLEEEVGSLVGFEPDFTIVIDLDAFGELVDTIGGVDFEIPYNMNYDDPLQDLSIHFKAGMTHLDGDEAMELIRYRHTPTGDIGRIELQQSFLTAVMKQCLSIGTVTKIPELAEIFEEYVDTELTVDNLIYFGKAALNGLNTSDISFYTLPYESKSVWSRTQNANLSYVVPVADELVDIINEGFNPYLTDVSVDDLDVMSVNSDGSVSSSTGVLEDSKAG